ncbi:NADH-quinone oxidoreductase subunit J [Buchnera aphidicola (Thelaxes californica)]|uniref:NADH-quinone oxidoreductase subunit J n=1 Tax=Buchnera aphidicola (Thelaxes californica) TaxID=1315998 RepID=A0A4D6YC54_9GAMM|nr:NADH-quinone oxidoreductase subunit J [Buchnera aphidicola]QCI26682.1 NADH-quinone oxidoreductase subunit J [Buchnera aphidicola (Thelaxes californica)]
MNIIFYVLSSLTILFTFFAVIQNNPINSLLFLIFSLLSISGIFFIVGSIFSAVLEIIIYTGAIMVLFLFIVMLLNLNINFEKKERKWMQNVYKDKVTLLIILLFFIFIFSIFLTKYHNIFIYFVDGKEIGRFLFGPFFIIVELASILLLSALVVVLHFLKIKNISIK